MFLRDRGLEIAKLIVWAVQALHIPPPTAKGGGICLMGWSVGNITTSAMLRFLPTLPEDVKITVAEYLRHFLLYGGSSLFRHTVQVFNVVKQFRHYYGSDGLSEAPRCIQREYRLINATTRTYGYLRGMGRSILRTSFLCFAVVNGTTREGREEFNPSRASSRR